MEVDFFVSLVFRLTAETTRFHDGFKLVLPDEARLEAPRLFFSVSPENLAIFAS
jgi:hypothetical protein